MTKKERIEGSREVIFGEAIGEKFSELMKNVHISKKQGKS